MTTFTVTRIWSLAGWVATEIEADTEETARAIEAAQWQAGGAVASLPPELRRHLEEITEDVEAVDTSPSL